MEVGEGGNVLGMSEERGKRVIVKCSKNVYCSSRICVRMVVVLADRADEEYKFN